jgi:hypothetical protein
MMNGGTVEELNGHGSMMGPGGASPLEPNPGGPTPGPAQGVHGAAPSDIIEFLEAVTHKGPIDSITIWQETLDGRQKLRTIGVKAIDPIALSASISRLVVEWTRARNQRTTFFLDAHAGAEHRGSHPIIRDVQATLTSQATEPPTETGVLAQTMRHQESSMRTTHVMQDAMAGHLTRRLREQDALIEKLQNDREAVAQKHLAALMASVDIEYQREQNKLKHYAQGQVVAVLLQSLPAIIQKFTANEVVEKFRAFVAGLKPEQQFAIGAALTKDQAEQLAGLFKALEAPELPGAVKALTAGETPAEAPPTSDAPKT